MVSLLQHLIANNCCEEIVLTRASETVGVQCGRGIRLTVLRPRGREKKERKRERGTLKTSVDYAPRKKVDPGFSWPLYLSLRVIDSSSLR